MGTLYTQLCGGGGGPEGSENTKPSPHSFAKLGH